MCRNRLTLHASGILVVLVLVSSTASAQATRTWVSGVGDDANPGSRTAPCKTFAGAISKTAADGEIDCLDPGGFGAVTITKSITIDGSQSTIRISNCTVTRNFKGLASNGGGKIISFGNNRIAGNTTDGAPTSTITQQ